MTKGVIIVFDDYLEEGYKGARIAVDVLVKKFENEISEFALLNRLYYIRKK